MARLGIAQPFPPHFKAPAIVGSGATDTALSPGVGATLLAGAGTSTGLGIGMPDER